MNKPPGVLTSVQAAGGTLEWKAALTGFFISFITATGLHYGLLKPAAVTGDAGVIAKSVTGGIGPTKDPTSVMPGNMRDLLEWHEKQHAAHHVG